MKTKQQKEELLKRYISEAYPKGEVNKLFEEVKASLYQQGKEEGEGMLISKLAGHEPEGNCSYHVPCKLCAIIVKEDILQSLEKCKSCSGFHCQKCSPCNQSQ